MTSTVQPLPSIRYACVSLHSHLYQVGIVCNLAHSVGVSLRMPRMRTFLPKRLIMRGPSYFMKLVSFCAMMQLHLSVFFRPLLVSEFGFSASKHSPGWISTNPAFVASLMRRMGIISYSIIQLSLSTVDRVLVLPPPHAVPTSERMFRCFSSCGRLGCPG